MAFENASIDVLLAASRSYDARKLTTIHVSLLKSVVVGRNLTSSAVVASGESVDDRPPKVAGGSAVVSASTSAHAQTRGSHSAAIRDFRRWEYADGRVTSRPRQCYGIGHNTKPCKIKPMGIEWLNATQPSFPRVTCSPTLRRSSTLSWYVRGVHACARLCFP